MHVSAACVDEGAPLGINVRGAGRVVTIVRGNRPNRDCDQAGTGVGMPPRCSSRIKCISDNIEVRGSLRVNSGLPEVGDIRARINVPLCRDINLIEGRSPT
jgi:hypothetical protein